jgi:hypothetical protein
MISMRLLLYSDGSWRTDFGSFSELGGMPLVVGYSGPGSHPAEEAVDASERAWGDPWAGTRDERAAGEEFGPGKPCDLGHLWVRWAGYPERKDPASPPPSILSPVLRNGVKITMLAAGSNIAEGARLVVDGVEAFPLARSASGGKWVVGKRAVSAPGARTVQQIWSDGQPHAIRAVNPDGEASAPVAIGG